MITQGLFNDIKAEYDRGIHWNLLYKALAEIAMQTKCISLIVMIP